MTTRMTAAQLQEHLAGKSGKADKGRVRGAERTEVDGIVFASKLEAQRWQELRILASVGQISDLRRQVSIVLQGQDGPIRTPGGRPMRYVADFIYRDSKGHEIIEDAKGHQTDVSAMKVAILAAQGVTVRLIRKSESGNGRWTENDATALYKKIMGGRS